MYSELNETFDYNGTKYTVKLPFRNRWPCQHCDLFDQCSPEAIRADEFPKCLANERVDLTQVVFQVYEPPKPERPSRRRTSQERRD